MDNKFNQQEFKNLVRQLMLQELKSRRIKENLEDDDLGIYSGDFNPEEFEGAAMQAAMADIGNEFEPLGQSKFEKNLDPNELKADLQRQNLLLPKDQEELKKIKKTLNVKKSHEKKFGAGSLNETGEWSDDAEGQAWIAGLKNELEWVQNMIAPAIPFYVNSIKGFDKYQGPYANVHIAGDNYKIWTTEEDKMWIENFPIDNTSKRGMRAGFEGDARQLAAAINTQYSVLSPIHMNERWDDFDEGPQPGDSEYHYPKITPQKGIGKFNNIDWQILHETLVANTEYYGTGKVEGNPRYIEIGVNDLVDSHEGMLTIEEFKLLEDYDLLTVVKHYPIISDEKYLDYNTFYEAAKAAWEKGPIVHNDNSSETPYLRGREDSDLIGEEFDETDVSNHHFDMKSLYHYLQDAFYYLKDYNEAEAAQILEATLKRDYGFTGNINEGHVNPDTKIDRPKDAEGNPITLKARVETLDGSAAGRVMRFGVNEEGKMTVHVMWIGNFGANVPNTITPIDQIVVRDKNRIVREDVDGNYMYKQNLNMIKDATEVLLNKLSDDNMEDWAEDKISKCAESMRAVRDYYNHGETEIEEGIGQSLTVGKGQNLKPSNYPEERTRTGLNENLDAAQTISDEVFLVVNSGFNKAHYPDLIGKTFPDAPGFAQVKLIKPEDLETEKAIDYDDAGKPDLQEVTHNELLNDWPGKKVKILIGPYADYPKHYGVVKTEDGHEYIPTRDKETGAMTSRFGSGYGYKPVRKVGANDYDVDIDIFDANGKKVYSDTYAFDYLFPIEEVPVAEEFDYAAAEREHHAQEELKDLNMDAQKYIAEELQQFYVPNTFNITEADPQSGRFEYSYELKIPKQADEATKDIEKFVREEEGVYNGGPGQTYQKVYTSAVLEKMTNTWVVNVTVTRGYDV